MLPKVFEAPAEYATPVGYYGVRTTNGPPLPFQSAADRFLTTGLDYAGEYAQTLRSELCVLHACAVSFQVACCIVLAQGCGDLVDMVLFKNGELFSRPCFRKLPVTIDLPRLFPKVLFCMKNVNDLSGVRKQFAGDVPDPVGPVSQNDAPLSVIRDDVLSGRLAERRATAPCRYRE